MTGASLKLVYYMLQPLILLGGYFPNFMDIFKVRIARGGSYRVNKVSSQTSRRIYLRHQPERT